MPKQTPSNAVYMRRRLLVLAALLAVVWAGIQFWPSGSDEPTTKPTPKAAPTETAGVPDGPLRVRLAAADGDCDPEAVRITPSVRPKQTNYGPIDIGLVVSTTSKTACTLQPDDADLVAIITQNDTTVWDSTRCPQSLLTQPVKLSPRWSTFVVAPWSGKVSGSSCSSKEKWAPSGKFTIEAGTLGGEPGKTTFDVQKGVKPTPSPKPKPTATPSGSATPTPTETP